MDPILDIQTIRAGVCTYSLRAPGQPARPCDEYFDSLEHCLHDAAGSLLHYFERVQLHLSGLPIGSYGVACLFLDSLTIADEARARFEQVHGDRRFGGMAAPLPMAMAQGVTGPQRLAHS